MHESNRLRDTNNRLKKEAGVLLHEKGLLALLARFGKPEVTGSYALDLMSWRDLDIYLEVAEFSGPDFFSMGGEIASLLQPVKMQFRNELIGESEGLPRGWYWGVYLGNERAGAWKIDIWAVQADEYRRLLRYCSNLAGRLNVQNRQNILEVKSGCWQDPGYRKKYNSAHIYRAVLDAGITTGAEFQKWLASQGIS